MIALARVQSSLRGLDTSMIRFVRIFEGRFPLNLVFEQIMSDELNMFDDVLLVMVEFANHGCFIQASLSENQLYILDFNRMSDQFSFEEEHPIDWLKEASQFTENNLSLNSDLSKSHFLDELLKPHKHQQTPAAHHHLKQRNKNNSKNYRQRKKQQNQHIKREVEHLRKENETLRNQKYCRFCRKPYDPNVLFQAQSYISTELSKTKTFLSKEEPLEIEAEFQKPELIINKKQEKRAKIWIALGILMLVLGLTLHGFDGNNREVKEIQIYREEMAKWTQQFNSKDEQYIEVSMRVKEEPKSVSKVDPGELKILYRSQGQKLGNYEEDKVSINKELLFGIHAQLDDLGVYF